MMIQISSDVLQMVVTALKENPQWENLHDYLQDKLNDVPHTLRSVFDTFLASKKVSDVWGMPNHGSIQAERIVHDIMRYVQHDPWGDSPSKIQDMSPLLDATLNFERSTELQKSLTSIYELQTAGVWGKARNEIDAISRKIIRYAQELSKGT